MHAATQWIRDVLSEGRDISIRLFKIMIPVLVVVKILQELGAVVLLGRMLSPVMQLVGLPGSMGLLWATTMLTCLYGGLLVFASLSADYPLTVAQATVLTSMMLVAHGLPVELRIAQVAGVRLYVMGTLRVAGAFFFGAILNQIYSRGNWLQEVNTITCIPPAADPSLTAWLLGQLKGLATIYVVILGLLVLMRLLKRLKVTDFLTKALNPVLRLLGIGKDASTVTIIGMTLGLAYGGGLIIREATSGRLKNRDILFSLALMGLSHSLIEDTLLAAFLGGHFSGIFWGRILFSLVCIFLLVRSVSRISQETFDRYLFLSRSS